MPRSARQIDIGCPHHITQRGNNRQDVFLTDEDRTKYLLTLKENCTEENVQVLSYCLMTNHVHVVVIPNTETGLAKAIGQTHLTYAQAFNRSNGTSGHLWQGRFKSFSMDEAHTMSALRYVERNPVRAGICRDARDFHWSSASAHCLNEIDKFGLLDMSWWRLFSRDLNWAEWIATTENDRELMRIRGFAQGGGRWKFRV